MRLVGTSLVIAVVLLAATQAEAAWTPDLTTYKANLATVRTNMSAWYGNGASASTLPAKAQRYVLKADAKLAKALSVLGTTPGAREVAKSLKQVRKAAKDLEKAGRKASTVTAFQTFLTSSTNGVLPALYAESRTLAIAAANYATANDSSSRATRKVLRSGGKTTRARQLVNQTPARYSRAIEKNRDAIRVLRRAKLL